MKAVVMAGGEGTRLRPLTCNIPKPMIPVMDKPVMEYSLELLKQHGIKDIAVTLQYLPGVVQEYFGDGSDRGLNLKYYVEEVPLGTAGSVKNAEEFLDQTFIVISGDALTDFPLAQAIEFHKQRGALATLVLTKVESPLEYGLVLTNRDGLIARFLEKPSWGEVFSDTVNTGIYILEPEIFDWIEPGTQYDFSRDLFPRLLAQKMPLYGCTLRGYWCDIGNCHQYRQVHFDILDGRAQVNIPGEKKGGTIVDPSARMSPRVRLEGPVYIGPNCYVEAGARLHAYTILGEGTVVEKGSSLKRTVVGSGCLVGGFSELRGAILGKGVRVKGHCSVYDEAVIGDDCQLEEEVVIRPGVKIWPGKTIEAGKVVNDSVIWSGRVARNLFSRRGIVGDLNGDLAPEKLARLGKALGSHLPIHSRVAVSSDGSMAAQAGRNAFVSGLMVSGVEVIDIGPQIMPVLRYAVPALNLRRGFYLSLAGSHEITLFVVNEFGLDLPKGEERKAENHYLREEYRPVPVDQIKPVSLFAEIGTAYLKNLCNGIDREMVSKARLNLVIGSDAEMAGTMAARMFDQLGCKVFRTEGLGYETTQADGDAGLENVVRETVRRGADAGVYLTTSGEKLVLVSSQGRVIREEHFIALMTGLFSPNFSEVFLPVDAPSAIEHFVKGMGKNVIRTRTFAGDFMLALHRAGEYEQLRFHIDGLFAASRIIEYLAKNAVSLSELVRALPKFYYVRREVPVSWRNKGRVIRRLTEEIPSWTGYETIEGIKIAHENGTSLILPDQDRAVCWICSEAFSQELAESLTEFCLDKIKHICQEEE